MYFVGVPPYDILRGILQLDAHGKNAIDRKRDELTILLASPRLFEAVVEARVRQGEFDLDEIARRLADGTAPHLPEAEWTADGVPTSTEAKAYLTKKLHRQYIQWRDRLCTKNGFIAMEHVNEGFRYKHGELHCNKHMQHEWRSLAGVLQGGWRDRQRIWYYHAVAVEWMEHPLVDALTGASLDSPRFARRVDLRQPDAQHQEVHPRFHAVLGYGDTLRPTCPPKPWDLPWSNAMKRPETPDDTTSEPPEDPIMLVKSVTLLGEVTAERQLPAASKAMRSIIKKTTTPVAVPTGPGEIRVVEVPSREVRDHLFGTSETPAMSPALTPLAPAPDVVSTETLGTPAPMDVDAEALSSDAMPCAPSSLQPGNGVETKTLYSTESPKTRQPLSGEGTSSLQERLPQIVLSTGSLLSVATSTAVETLASDAESTEADAMPSYPRWPSVVAQHSRLGLADMDLGVSLVPLSGQTTLSNELSGVEETVLRWPASTPSATPLEFVISDAVVAEATDTVDHVSTMSGSNTHLQDIDSRDTFTVHVKFTTSLLQPFTLTLRGHMALVAIKMRICSLCHLKAENVFVFDSFWPFGDVNRKGDADEQHAFSVRTCSAARIRFLTVDTTHADVPFGVRSCLDSTAGLSNLGNSCFMNASLQSLVGLPLFREHFLSQTYLRALVVDATAVEASMLKSFADIVCAMCAGNAASILPGRFYRCLSESLQRNRSPHGAAKPTFCDGRQHDAMEFLEYLLATIDMDSDMRCLLLHELHPFGVSAPFPDFDAASSQYRYFFSRIGFTDTVFLGFQASTIACSVDDRHTSIAYDPIQSVKLAFPISGEPVALDHLLSRYFETEILSGDDRWYCPYCNKYVDGANKQLQFYSLPLVLLVQLKRFQYSAVGEFVRRKRIDTAVNYPAEGLDLQPYTASVAPSGAASTCYDLASLVVQTGSLDDGHYRAYSRSAALGTWYHYNDGTVISF
jgi:ubiquitin carboxyl-terminal hydrolase 8